MAEMTAEKVKTLLESFAAVCGSNAKAKELCSDAIKFVEQQQQTISELQTEITYQNKQIARLQEDLSRQVKEASNDV